MNGRSCLFATFLAGSLQHSSIKVYLSGVRALHIEQGFADPLHNCLRLQRVIRGIKRTQGSPSSSRLPITDDLMLVIRKSLNLQLPDHCMFWAACTLGNFGFLRSAEFTVPSLATPPLPGSFGRAGYRSGLQHSSLVHPRHYQGVQDRSVPQGLLHSYWPRQVSPKRCPRITGLLGYPG